MPWVIAYRPTSFWLENLVLCGVVSQYLAVRACSVTSDWLSGWDVTPWSSSHTNTDWSRKELGFLPTLSGSCDSGSNVLDSESPSLFPKPFTCLATFNLKYHARRARICLRVKEAWKVLDFSLALSFGPTKAKKPISHWMLYRLWRNRILSHSSRLIPKCMALKGLCLPQLSVEL